MENPSAKKSITDTILEMTKSAENNTTPIENISGSSDGSWFQNISWTTWLVVIVILLLLGFNIFYYLYKGSEEFNNLFGPLFKKIFGSSLALSGETISVAAEGGKAVVTGTATGVNAGLSAVQQEVTPNKASSSVQSDVLKNKADIQAAENSLNKALNNSKANKPLRKGEENEEDGEDDYEPHEASSSVHTGKAGWCFIGEDKGYRTCTKVGIEDKCMSGDIFPSQDLCINPNLRS